jgi:hypothetical protein
MPGMAPGMAPGMMPPGMAPGMRPAPMPVARGPAGPATPFKVNYITNAIAVDFRGGERLRGRRTGGLGLAGAGDILLLDSDGNLIVRNEMEDKAAYERLKNSQTPPPAAGGGLMDAGHGPTPHGGGLEGLPGAGGTPARGGRKAPTRPNH